LTPGRWLTSKDGLAECKFTVAKIIGGRKWVLETKGKVRSLTQRDITREREGREWIGGEDKEGGEAETVKGAYWGALVAVIVSENLAEGKACMTLSF